MTDNNIINIIDITSEDSEHDALSMSTNEIIPFQKGVQFKCLYTLDQNKINEIITISDSSDDENTPYQQINEKSIDFIPKKKYVNTSTRHIKTSKRPHKNPLNDCNKRFRGDSSSSFIVDKRRVIKQQYNFTNGLKKKLRPIIIDGMNIGHA